MKEQIANAGPRKAAVHDRQVDEAGMFSHPDDVLHDRRLTSDQKRSILASWLSDMRAVDDAPSLRRLDTGALVKVDAILGALKELDGMRRDQRFASAARAVSRRKRPLWPSTKFHRRHNDDDDLPPAAPAVSCFPSTAFAVAG